MQLILEKYSTFFSKSLCSQCIALDQNDCMKSRLILFELISLIYSYTYIVYRIPNEIFRDIAHLQSLYIYINIEYIILVINFLILIGAYNFSFLCFLHCEIKTKKKQITHLRVLMHNINQKNKKHTHTCTHIYP